jgi:5-methylcytosine-specific restriction endonuclease McrA
MVNRALRSQLLRRLGITPQALSQRAKRIKKRFGPMTTDEAVYVIAHMAGLDLSKFLPLEILDRIRSLVPREVTALAVRPRVHQMKHKRPRIKVSSYPLVQEALLRAGLRIGNEIYPQLFALENSIRRAVEMQLSTSGEDWWDRLVPDEVQRNVQRTIARERRYRHREPRSDRPLYYSNFDDLRKIVLANQPYFNDIIQDFEWFRVRMEDAYIARNKIAHCVPLGEDDSANLLTFQREWARLLTAAGFR